MDTITGTPLLQETDLELPFGSAVFRHIRTFGQYHELRHEMRTAGDAIDHIVRGTVPGGEFWESTGNGWTMTTSPLLLIDAQYQILAGTPGGPRRCVFMPDAHHAISFIQDTGSGVFIAPSHFGAQLSHNGTWVSVPNDDLSGGYWSTRPTVFRVWLYDGAVCYTIRPLYEDVFPGFLPTQDDREWGMYSDNDPVESLGDCRNPIPYWGLCERIDDRFGNCIDLEYCEFRARDVGNGSCQACTVNYNEKGQVARTRLVSGVPFNPASDWQTDIEWDAAAGNHPFDYDETSHGEPGVVEWTLLYTYRSFWSDFAYDDPEDPDLSYPHAYARENAIHSIHVYPGDPEANQPPTCRTISLEEFYNPASQGNGGTGGGWWMETDSSRPNLDPIDTLETIAFPGEYPAEPSYTVHYMYAEPKRFDRDPGTESGTPADTAWYDAAYGYSCGNARGAARLLKTTVTERVVDVEDAEYEDQSTYRLYRYDAVGGREAVGDQIWYVHNHQQTTTLQHVYDNAAVMGMLEYLNADLTGEQWGVNHLVCGVGPAGAALEDVTEPFGDVAGQNGDQIPVWDTRATRSLYAWDGLILDGDTFDVERSNDRTGSWGEFETSGFAATMAGIDFAALSATNAMFMQPGVALLAERGIGGSDRYARVYRFYVSGTPYPPHTGSPFWGWDAGWSPLRSVLHEPYRMPDYNEQAVWQAPPSGQSVPQRELGELVWVTVIDEYSSLYHATKATDESDQSFPLTRRAIYHNAAGFVLMDRTWEFTDDGAVVSTQGYTETYGYDEHGRMTHIYSPGWNSLGNPLDDPSTPGPWLSKGLITRFEYWPAEDRDGKGGSDPRGPIDIPMEVRAKGVQQGSGPDRDVYYSEVTERLEDAAGKIIRFDLITELLRFSTPTTTYLDGVYTSEPARTTMEYEFVKDTDDDGQEEEAPEWVITSRKTLGPAVALDDSGDRYRPHEAQVFDAADDDTTDAKRGRLRWRVYGMEPEPGASGAHTSRYFDYYHYDEQGRVTRQVVDAAAGQSLGELVDFLGKNQGQDDPGGVPAYPWGAVREAPDYLTNSVAKHKITKTVFSSRGPLIIEHPDGTQTHMGYRRRLDGLLEIRTARGFIAPPSDGDPPDAGVPHGPGQITFIGRDSPASIKHVVWDDWRPRRHVVSQDYTVIAETNTETDAGGRPTAATQSDWRGNQLRVEARLDRFGSMSRRIEPDGTVSRTAADPRGRPERLFIGTEDGHGFWNNGQDPGDDNMVLTEHFRYGGGETDAGLQIEARRFREFVEDRYFGGDLDGVFADLGAKQETRYDWRMRPIWQQTCTKDDDDVPLRHTVTVYDNLDRVRFVAEYGAIAPIPDAQDSNALALGSTTYRGAVDLPSASDMLATSPVGLTETVYNGAGQVERVIEYDLEDPGVDNFHASTTFYDRKNRETFKIQPSSAATITENDAEGRVMSRRTVLDPFDADPYEITRTEYVYDDQGRQIEVANYERTHDATGTRLQLGVNAIVTWQWSWYDYNGRLKATASLGAGDGSSDQLVNPTAAPERPVGSPSLSVAGVVGRGALPEHAILTCYRYDASGRQSAVATQLTAGSSPTYRVDRSYYDGMGNLRFSKENATGAAGQIRKTAYKYDSQTGQLTHITAVLPGHEMFEYIGFQGENPETDSAVYIEPTWDAADGTLQVTRIEYGAEVYTGDGRPTSQHNGWVKAVYFPHPETGQPSPTPSLTFTYTIDGLVRTRTDALGRTFTHTYDQFGKRKLTTIDYNWPANDPYAAYRPLDLADRLEYDYDDRDRLIRATAIRVDNGADVIIADNTYAYDARGNLLAEQQSYGDAASPDPRAGDPKEVVQYTWDYANYAAGNHLRLDTMEYPQRIQTGTTREVKFEYGDSEDLGSDSLSRISAIHDLLADVRAEFTFAGVGRRVGVETTRDASTAPATVWGQSFAAAGVVGYPGLDRHGRPTDLHFVDGAGADIHRYEYSYNAAGDRLSSLVRQVGEVNTRSWAYGYDQLSRLVTAERGTLLADHSGIDHYTATVAERTSWGLDTLGNWTEPSGLNGSYAGRVAEAFESGTGEYSLLLEEQAHTTDQRNRLERIEITEGNTPTTTDTHVYDHAGQLVADAEYWYQYDAFGRLASVHGRGDLTFLSSGTISGGTPGAWRLYLAYDGLGRLIREQKPWDGGSDHRQAWFYYDGVRRIVEVFKDPIVGAAMPLGAAPGGGYTTYTEREYVWGPDYVDECLWQVTRPGGVLHVLQDASKDVVALLDEAGAVARQYSYDAYGQVQFEDVFGTPAYNRLGHHGLFFDRLDVDAPAVELAAGARGLYHNRNRTYDPRTGRFTTSDPNGTAVSLAGEAAAVEPFAIGALYRDGLSAYAYLRAAPVTSNDPYGLFWDSYWDDMEDGGELVLNAATTFESFSDGAGVLGAMLEQLVTDYAMNLEADLEWSMDWKALDDVHTRLDNSWVNLSMARGAYAFYGLDYWTGARDTRTGPEMAGRFPTWIKRLAPDMPVHHIATWYGRMGRRLDREFRAAGMTLKDAANALPLFGHRGAHDPAYHDWLLGQVRMNNRRLQTLAERHRALRTLLWDVGEMTRRGEIDINDFRAPW